MSLISTGITDAKMFVTEKIRRNIINTLMSKIKIMRENGSNCDDLYKQLKRWQNDTSTNSNTISSIRDKTISNTDSHCLRRGRLLLLETRSCDRGG